MKSKSGSNDGHSTVRRLVRRWSRKWQVHSLVDKLRCEWSFRLTRSLGRAYPSRLLVRLNPLLQRPPYSVFFEEVLCHEVAHVVVFTLHGPKAPSHGVEWKQLLKLAGYEPRRELFIKNDSRRDTSAARYAHTCPVCQATRVARNPHPRWRCVACRRAGLEGELVIHSFPAAPEARDV